jgi:hypothetical protein
MKGILTFALSNPTLLVVPALALVFSLVMLRIKKRYVNEGLFLRRKPATERHRCISKSVGNEMSSDNDIDLEIALRKFRELGLADGDLRYAYWGKVAHLLKRAARMQTQIDKLNSELEQCRAMRRRKN